MACAIGSSISPTQPADDPLDRSNAFNPVESYELLADGTIRNFYDSNRGSFHGKRKRLRAQAVAELSHRLALRGYDLSKLKRAPQQAKTIAA